MLLLYARSTSSLTHLIGRGTKLLQARTFFFLHPFLAHPAFHFYDLLSASLLCCLLMKLTSSLSVNKCSADKFCTVLLKRSRTQAKTSRSFLFLSLHFTDVQTSRLDGSRSSRSPVCSGRGKGRSVRRALVSIDEEARGDWRSFQTS
jgi:hypothetical protein